MVCTGDDGEDGVVVCIGEDGGDWVGVSSGDDGGDGVVLCIGENGGDGDWRWGVHAGSVMVEMGLESALKVLELEAGYGLSLESSLSLSCKRVIR